MTSKTHCSRSRRGLVPLLAASMFCTTAWAAQPAQPVRQAPSGAASPGTSAAANLRSSETGAVVDRLVLREGRIEAVDPSAHHIVLAGRRLHWEAGRIQLFTWPARSAASVSDLRPGQRIRFALEGKDGERADDSERRRIVLIYLESRP
ncbi:MAG: hypothetical protein IPG57_18175 [Burkholderiales bacterium]|jgi:hypothetical protein|nr:hypothetical protein [Burkholderiales bacterium]MBP7522006.1 hypothetical protein [Leptothrix sp. (in: b-proteobacteria)]